MTQYLAKGDEQSIISPKELEQQINELLCAWGDDLKRVLIIPPDHTRLFSKAGEITQIIYQRLIPNTTVNIMPALGTHFPMTEAQCHMMFGKDIPMSAYLPHDWRNGLVQLGELSKERIHELSEGKLNFPMDVGVNRELLEGNYDLIISIGQIVPHEVIGMANYTKNIMIGVGGGDTIHKSHYLGAVYGMERIMGEIDSPVRTALNESYDTYVRPHVNLQFILTVMGKEKDDLVMRGLFAGNDQETFADACRLSQKVNLNHLHKPIKKCVVYLDPNEFHSTWLGNKAVYRSRKAMADDGELIILAPELKTFGEDPEIDRLIRKYGYLGTEQTLKDVEANDELRQNLSAAAHLIHGTSDGRFKITYCPGDGLTEEEIRSVGFNYAPYEQMRAVYQPEQLKDGWNEVNGEEIFYISNPALGLWVLKD